MRRQNKAVVLEKGQNPILELLLSDTKGLIRKVGVGWVDGAARARTGSR